jgi:hypothetical protein
VYRAKELILSASAGESFPALSLFWSPNNRASVGAFCPDNGDIGTTFYIGSGSSDQCTVSRALPAGIYVLGDFANGNGDTDEFDQNVLAHEFGHYVEAQFSRSDSVGGLHTMGNRLDLRVAFGEGWGNAYSAMVMNDPVYRDSFAGISEDFSFSLEADAAGSGNPEGWFSEFSAGEILWDVFDPANEPGDNVALGFAPIFSVMTGAQVTTDALTSIYSFAAALRSANGAAAADITTLLNGESIAGNDAFGSNETNNGGDPTVLPVYGSLALNSQVAVCSTSVAGSEDANKLGNRKFLRFDNETARAVTIQAVGITGSVTQDPDIFVHRQGELVAVGEATGNTETISQQPLVPGTHIIEVYDFNVTGTNFPPRCMNVSIQGN